VPKYKVNDLYFDEWSPEMAWLLGYTWADGCVMQQDTRWRVVWVATEADIGILETVRALLGAEQNITPMIKGNYNGYECRQAYTLRVCNTRLAKTLVELHGMPPRKSFVDPQYPIIPDGYFGDFFRGFFDGNGSFSIRESPQRASYQCSQCGEIGHNSRTCGRPITIGQVSFSFGGKRFLSGLADQATKVIGVKQIQPFSRNQDNSHSLYWYSKADLSGFFSAMYPNKYVPCLRRKMDAFMSVLGDGVAA
jgi:hypothetical protein